MLVTFGAIAVLPSALSRGGGWLLLLVGALVGVVVHSLATRPDLDVFSFCLVAPPRTAVGDAVELRLHVHNNGPRPSPRVSLHHHVLGLEPGAVEVDSLPPGAKASFTASTVAASRGVHDACEILVETSAPLGLMRSLASHRYVHRLVVRPAVVPPAHLDPRALATEAASGAVGDEIVGVREWRPGLEPSGVHWRTTMRTGRPVLLDRSGSGPRTLHVAVVGPSAAPDWERVVAVAAATTDQVLRSGERVVLTKWTPPSSFSSYEPQSRDDLLDWWAALGALELVDPHALVAALPPCTQLVVVASGGMPDAWWSALDTAAATAGASVHRLTPDGPPA